MTIRSMKRKAPNAKMDMTSGAMTLADFHPEALPSEMAKTNRMRPAVREATPGQSRLFFWDFSSEDVAPGSMNQDTTENGMTSIARR